MIVPIYNAKKRLNKCIDSIVNQTFKDFELILLNDGSTDNSLEICKRYEKIDTRIKVINKENEGCIATRRKGVELAKSKYIMFVDADDWIDTKTIELLYKEAYESNSDVTVCNMYKVIGDKLSIKKENKSTYFNGVKVYNKEGIRNELIVAYFHGHPFPSSLCAKLYKRELLVSSGKYLDAIKFFGEDLYYNLEIFLKANKIKVINKALYFYRAGGTTSKYMPYFFDDIVNGYLIQQGVINKYYYNTKQNMLNGISIMLLNTFKTCLSNLFYSEYNGIEKRDLIKTYLSNACITEAINNEGAKKYFSNEYLQAIKNNDEKYLYQFGKKAYLKQRPKQMLLELGRI